MLRGERVEDHFASRKSCCCWVVVFFLFFTPSSSPLTRYLFALQRVQGHVEDPDPLRFIGSDPLEERTREGVAEPEALFSSMNSELLRWNEPLPELR